MVFTSVTFIVFFLPAFLAVYYLVPERHLRVRNAVLLLFSIVFYGWGGLGYLGLLLLSVLINTLSGFFIGKSRNQRGDSPLFNYTFFALSSGKKFPKI